MTDAPQRFTVWHGLFLAESAALLIALLMPITPSKTGAERGFPGLFFAEPSYGQEVAVYFLLTNGLIILLAAAAALWLRFKRPA